MSDVVADTGGGGRDPRGGLAVAAVLVIAGWAAGYAVAVALGGEQPDGTRGDVFLGFLVGMAVTGLLAVLGWVVGRWALRRSRFAIVAPLRSTLPGISFLGLSAGNFGPQFSLYELAPEDSLGWFVLVSPATMAALGLFVLALTALLVGGPHGLRFWRRGGLGQVRVPWSDIERVVFSNGLRPKTIEIGVALRPGAKRRRSMVRRHDVLTDLPCRVVVHRKSFDFAALQQLVAAHPQVTLVERSGAMERVWAGGPAEAAEEVMS